MLSLSLLLVILLVLGLILLRESTGERGVHGQTG